MTDDERQKLAKDVAWETFKLFLSAFLGGVFVVSLWRWFVSVFWS